MKVYTFTEPTLPAIGAVGGKGLSLMRMTGAGFAVPPGVVLPVEFFAPWVDALSTHDAWRALGDAHGDEALSRACADLKGACAGLAFTDAQRRALDEALGHFASTTFFAVRSSSPEEDLDGSSFAGGYETVLGVPRDAMEPAVRRAFASCLDVRVAVYKRAHGFDVTRPRIAVVVQKQVASDVAGVGFSVDPITNDHDRAVFNANWGLGETVVAGLASPDLFTVDKVARAVIGRAPGRKETSIWLTPSGGTVEREDPRHDTLTLTDDQVLALADQLARIEAHYGRPMDIEWAFEAGALYILQARPITTHRSLPEGMMTAPGERRRLYWDVSVSVQGVFDPLSPMASSCWQAMISAASEAVFGRDITREVERSPVIIRGGRLWAHVSALLTVVPLRSMIEMIPAIDPVAAATLATIEDEAPWRTEHSLKGVPWGLLWHAPEKAAQLLEARLAPEHARAHVDALCARLRAEVEALADERLPFDRFANEAVARTARGMFLDVLPCFVSAKIAMGKIRGIFEDATEEESRWLAKLDQSLPGNVTVEMGLALVDLAAHLPPDMTLDALERGVAEGSAPRDFLAGWRDFLARYGHRGPGEIDVASPRYRDRPRMLLSQLAGVAGASGTDASPRAIYERSQRERREAFEALDARAAAKGWLTQKRFRSLYSVVEALGGLRETPKFLLVQAFDHVRTRALAEADALLAAGRLDARDDVFWLTFEELGAGLADASIDLRAQVKAHRDELRRLQGRTEPPRFLDSRGRILRPAPPPLREGELAGHPISPGVVRGRVKVLHAPDEKPLLPGEVLVARATDPGWTPLFVNAVAVVLEVGGVMQHGALVAREYGRACVAGVEGATTRLRDGELVEVDGSAGTVRRVTG